MEELQLTPGLAGRLLGGGGAAGLSRRLGDPGTPEAAEVRCPRCDSANTKFCYYNNYNLAQPRHFCRACLRYWTKGGLLRNVPVGGGCRKPKRKRPAAAAGKNGDGAHRDAQNPRSGSAGASSSAADAPVTSHASSVAARPSVPRSSSVVETSTATGPFAAGDTLPPLLPPPALMFPSLFAPLRLPAVSFSAQPKAEEGVNTVLAEQPASPSTSAAPDTTPFAVQSGGGLTIGHPAGRNGHPSPTPRYLS